MEIGPVVDKLKSVLTEMPPVLLHEVRRSLLAPWVKMCAVPPLKLDG